MHSSLPQQLTNLKFTRSKLLIGTFTLLENRCLRKADAIITICPDLANYVNSLVRHNHHALIENSIFDQVKIRTSSSRRSDNTVARNPYPETVAMPENRRFVVYAGTLEPYQGIELLIDAFAEVISKSPEAYLLIVGGTPLQVANYAALVEKNGFTPDCPASGKTVLSTCFGFGFSPHRGYQHAPQNLRATGKRDSPGCNQHIFPYPGFE
jgi:glycosyltransferase involved in cell wall biosynthesis